MEEASFPSVETTEVGSVVFASEGAARFGGPARAFGGWLGAGEGG